MVAVNRACSGDNFDLEVLFFHICNFCGVKIKTTNQQCVALSAARIWLSKVKDLRRYGKQALHMDKGPSRLVWIGLAGIMAASVLAAVIVESELLASVLVVCGTAVFFVPVLWGGPAYLRSPKPTDERYEQLHYRAGWYAYILLAWVVLVYWFVTSSIGVGLPENVLLWAVIVAVIVYWGLEYWFVHSPKPWS